MLEIRGVRRDIIGGYTHMTASAMARTCIFVTELVSQLERSPLNENAPPNMPCSNTHGAEAFAREEGAAGMCSHAHSARAPALMHRVLLQNMFTNTPALSDCNKRAIHDTFSAAPANWPYSIPGASACPAHSSVELQQDRHR